MMFTAIRLLPVLAIGSLLTSCQNGQNPFAQKSAGTDPYVSNYGNDGGYNPYPGSSGSTSGGYTSAPTYTPPPAPVEADPYAFNAPTSTPKTSSTPKKTVSSSKPKSSTAKKSTAKKSSGSYKVAKGDTLYGIAKKRGTTVAKIKSANGMSSDLIRPGQSLKIP